MIKITKDEHKIGMATVKNIICISDLGVTSPNPIIICIYYQLLMQSLLIDTIIYVFLELANVFNRINSDIWYRLSITVWINLYRILVNHRQIASN